MAESKGALIARSVQKHAGRAKEKLLQNLGKVDRTADEIFDEHLQNFNRQQQQAARLQKEFNNYIRCIRATQTASKSLMEAITEVYESGWSGHDLTYVQAQNMEMLWQDFSHKLGDQVLIPLNTYTQQFPEMRKKIDKRGRKLVDYDSQRHNYQAIQANSSKRRDDVKLTRGRELLEEAKRTYETLNTELHDELPALYDSRILFLVSNLQTLFAAEHVFHNESSKVYAELEAITDKLASESQRGSYTIKKTMSLSNNISPISSPNTNTLKSQNGTATPNTGTIQLTPPALNGSASEAEKAKNDHDKTQTDHDKSVAELDKSKIESDKPKAGLDRSTTEIDKSKPEFEKLKPESEKSILKSESSEVDELVVSKDEKLESAVHDSVVSPSAPARGSQDSNQENNHHDRNDKDKGEELYDIPVGATLSNLPAGVLYRVRATYRYTREDADELSFDVGEVIRVVEYDDPEEQEEGWLMGIKESTNEKGMFPANFTRPI